MGEERGWTKVLSVPQQALGRYDERGIFGTGPLVGVPNYGEYVTVFYNKDIFAANNLQVPTSLAEFEAVMDAFVKKGITPIAEAANDYPAVHLWYELALSKSDHAWVENFQGLKAPLDTQPFLFASQKLQEWVDKGYVSKDATGLTASDMVAQFEAGKSPIVVTGTWYAGEFGAKIANFKLGNFLFPGNSIHPASTGNIWVVPKSAKSKNLACDFIDITLGKDSQVSLGNAGGVALTVDASEISDPVGSELTRGANAITVANGLGYYPDWPVAGYYEVIRQKVQALVGGTITPEAAVDELTQTYNDAQAEAR